MNLTICLAGKSSEWQLQGLLRCKPKILILDEATSMLDPQGVKEVLKRFENCVKKLRLTVISITHDLEEAAAG